MSNAVFPTLAGLTWNVLKSPRWSSKVQQSVGGKEMRAAYWTTPLYTWQLTYELLRASALLELQALIGFFNARQGKFDSFLFSDPSDNSVTAMGFGVGDAVKTAFQLQRSLAGPRTLDWQGVQPFISTPRKNLTSFPEDFTNAAWTKVATTIGVNFYFAPNGTLTADKVQEDNTNSQHAITESTTCPLGTYTLSAWVRPVERTKCVLSMSDGAGGFASIGFDLTNGSTFSSGVAVGSWTGISFTATLWPDGWYRLTITGTRGAGTVVVQQLFLWTTALSYVGTTGSGVDAWGFKLEPGSFATSYFNAATLSPAYWPAAGDAFEPVLDLANAQPQIFVDGILKTFGSDYTISASGLITFTAAPAAGAALTWTGSYYWRVRFNDDVTEFNNFLSQLWEAKKVTLVSVKAA